MKAYYKMSSSHVLKDLDTDISEGMIEKDIRVMRSLFGKNSTSISKERKVWVGVVKELLSAWSLLILLIIVILVGLGEVEYALICVAIYSVYVAYIVRQVREELMFHTKLREFDEQSITVIREGSMKKIASKELVIGDIVYLYKGNTVPADMRVLQSKELVVKETTVTGEVERKEKYSSKIEGTIENLSDLSNMAFKSSTVLSGEGGVVTATGMNTELGEIVKNSYNKNKKEQKMNVLSRINDISNTMVLKVILPVVVIISGLMYVSGTSFELITKEVMLIIVIGTPIFIPFIMIISWWMLTVKMSEEGLKINNLNALRVLSLTDIIFTTNDSVEREEWKEVKQIYCSGNSYNIDRNKIRFSKNTVGKREYLSNKNISDSDLRRMFDVIYACNGERVVNETFKSEGGSFLDSFISSNIGKFDEEIKATRVARVFSNKQGHKTVVNRVGRKYRVNTLADFDEVLENATHIYVNGLEKVLGAKEVAELKNKAYAMYEEGMDVKGIAYRNFTYLPSENENVESNLVFVGIIGVKSSVDMEVHEGVALAKENDVRVILNYKSNKVTALARAKEVGLSRGDEYALSSVEFAHLTPQEMQRTIEKCDTYANLTAKQVAQLLVSLRKKGNTVVCAGSTLKDMIYLKYGDVVMALGEKISTVLEKSSDIILRENKLQNIVRLINTSKKFESAINLSLEYFMATGIAIYIYMILMNITAGGDVLNLAAAFMYNILVSIIVGIIMIRRDNIEFDENVTSRIGGKSTLIKGSIIGIAMVGVTYIANIIAGEELAVLGYMIVILSAITGVLTYSIKKKVYKDVVTVALVMILALSVLSALAINYSISAEGVAMVILAVAGVSGVNIAINRIFNWKMKA